MTSIAGDVSGLKHSDTSKLGARGSSEGAQLGAQQGASVLPGGGGILGLAVMGVGAIVGGVKGANEAQREDVVDQTRVFLRTAIEDTDFTELLRARLAAQIDHAAAVLAEAIPYDLYVSKQPRQLLFNTICMDSATCRAASGGRRDGQGSDRSLHGIGQASADVGGSVREG